MCAAGGADYSWQDGNHHACQACGLGHSLYGSRSRSLAELVWLSTTSVSRFAGSIWRMNSLHRPHGGTTCKTPSSSSQTATILAILYSCAVTMAAMAACSAQNPVPEPVSMQTPQYRLPAVVSSAHPTFPNSRSPT